MGPLVPMWFEKYFLRIDTHPIFATVLLFAYQERLRVMALWSLDNLVHKQWNKVPNPSASWRTDKSESLLTNIYHIRSSSDLRKSFFYWVSLSNKNIPVNSWRHIILPKKPERDGGLFYAWNNSLYSQHSGWPAHRCGFSTDLSDIYFCAGSAW